MEIVGFACRVLLYRFQLIGDGQVVSKFGRIQ